MGYCHFPNASLDAVLQAADAIAADPSASTALRGSFDALTINPDGSASVVGWAVDPNAAGGGRPAVTVAVEADGKVIWTGIADVSRPGACSLGSLR